MLRQWAGEPAWWVAVVLQLGLVFAAGPVFGRAAWRRAAVAVLALAAFVVPWLAPPHPVLRVFLALWALLPPVKAVELAADRRDHPAFARLWHFASPFDTRLARRADRRLDVPAAGRLLLHGAVGAAGLGLATLVAPGAGAVGREVAFLGGGLLLTYGLVDVGEMTLRIAHRLAGWEIPRVQLQPLASRTVQELWGARWNRPVSNFLSRFCFWPLARKGHPELGRASAFAVSAAMHAWLVLPPAGPRATAVMAGFFLVQGALVALERRLGVHRWPPAAAHAWTVVVLLGSSPLFVDPVMTCYGLSRPW